MGQTAELLHRCARNFALVVSQLPRDSRMCWPLLESAVTWSHFLIPWIKRELLKRSLYLQHGERFQWIVGSLKKMPPAEYALSVVYEWLLRFFVNRVINYPDSFIYCAGDRITDTTSTDYQSWFTSVSNRLPGVSAKTNAPQITIDDARNVTVNLRWQVPGDSNSHQMIVQTLITD